MADKENILKPGKTYDDMGLDSLINSPDPINPRDWLKTLGILGKKPGVIDELASAVGIIDTETTTFNKQIIPQQQQALKLLDTVNQAKMIRRMGPTEGNVAQADPTGALASRVGVQTGMVGPTGEDPGFEEMARYGTKNPNRPLDLMFFIRFY